MHPHHSIVYNTHSQRQKAKKCMFVDYFLILFSKKCFVSSFFAYVLMLCKEDKLEEAEPSMNKLLEKHPDDPFVAILHGLFEYLMEETEGAQSIWKQQFDVIMDRDSKIRHDDEEKAVIQEEEEEEYEIHTVAEEESEELQPSLLDLWIFSVQIALKFDCKQMAQTILKVSKSFFEQSAVHQIDFILMQHQVLIYNGDYETALKKLGEAILINDNDTKLWLHIGSTYSLLKRWSESIEALERHINECHDQDILPNLMGMFKLIEIYLLLSEENSKYLKNALSLIAMCWDRIEREEIYTDDQLSILVSFENRNDTFMQAIKYKLFSIQAQYFSKVNDTTSSLSYYAVKLLNTNQKYEQHTCVYYV